VRAGQQKNKGGGEEVKGFHNAAVLMQVKEIRRSNDMKEVAQMLSRGKWIAFYATAEEKCIISLGRVSD
jgi:hypothetical protein